MIPRFDKPIGNPAWPNRGPSRSTSTTRAPMPIYLAKDLAYDLERDFPVRIDWLPYVLDILSFLGSARVDESGRVVEEQRNAHQWRRVRYSYMDCRRQAKNRGL